MLNFAHYTLNFENIRLRRKDVYNEFLHKLFLKRSIFEQRSFEFAALIIP